MTCDRFRRSFAPATEDAEVLAHLRSCDACLDFAANVDPDVLFRALGGSEMIPPGGVDAFVEGVMQQVRVREAESVATPLRSLGWPRRLAIAATIVAGLSGALLVYRLDSPAPVKPLRPTAIAAHRPVSLTTKPVVETYESQNATIVEMPMEPTDDVKMVMIFDENLPADL
jgi:anti-sigma factor RsiW